eukprot:scaffold15267_cov118-Isochrysis_galbana.AAC.3
MASTFRPWHDLWAALLQFSPRPLPHGPLPTSTASAASAAATAIAAAAAAATAAAAAAASASAAATATHSEMNVQRANQVNVVQHTSYTSKDASIAKLLDVPANHTYICMMTT